MTPKYNQQCPIQDHSRTYVTSSTLSGRDGRFDSFPTVGYFTTDTFQMISFSVMENRKDGSRMERTTSEY